MRNLLAIVAVLVVFLPNISSAYDPGWPHPNEMKNLPPYCSSLIGEGAGAGTPAYNMWAKRLGDGFGHSHHYCAGLNFVNRALGPDRGEAGLVLRQAIREFDYVISMAPQTFVLMPEILVQKGRALTRLNRFGEAAQSFQKAIELNRKYPPAYAALSDLWRKLGKPDESRKVLQEGLQASPNSTLLKRKLQSPAK